MKESEIAQTYKHERAPLASLWVGITLLSITIALGTWFGFGGSPAFWKRWAEIQEIKRKDAALTPTPTPTLK